MFTPPSARYPDEFPSRMTVRLESGRSFTHEALDYPGFPTRPFNWQEVSAKFDGLAAGRADESVCRQIKDAMRSLETIQVADLMEPLRSVKAPTRHSTGAARPAAQKEQLR
jgi:2-methylcitrate dehydratase